MARQTEPCRKCGAPVGLKAKRCSACNTVLRAISASPKSSVGTKNIEHGCSVLGAIGIIGGLIWLLNSCGSDDPPKTPEELQSEAAAAVANKEAGFHCLSAWDGSHSGLVRQLKATLRDPSSFEHDDTIIGPQDGEGRHTIMMRYRARNGFGGLNIGYVQGTVSNASCDATIIEVE